MAQPLNLNLTIAASPMHVWKTMLDETHYRKWTEVWPGSTYVGDWSEGSVIFFVDSTGAGLEGHIAANRPGDYVETNLHHELAPGRVPRTETAAIWEGAKECYRFSPHADGCLLEILLEAPNMPDGMAEYMASTWPTALQAIKSICEATA